MARYELILKQDGAIWLRIISKPLLTPKGGIKDSNIQKKNLKVRNSEGFLAEVFHPWVRWEGPGSGFENSSGGAGGAAGGGVWGPSWAQVGGPKPGPSGWAQDTQIWPPWD